MNATLIRPTTSPNFGAWGGATTVDGDLAAMKASMLSKLKSLKKEGAKPEDSLVVGVSRRGSGRVPSVRKAPPPVLVMAPARPPAIPSLWDSALATNEIVKQRALMKLQVAIVGSLTALGGLGDVEFHPFSIRD